MTKVLVIGVFRALLVLVLSLAVWPLWNFGTAEAFDLPTLSFVESLCTVSLCVIIASLFRTEVNVQEVLADE